MLALFASACGKQIGDPCATNLDCQTDGTRDCDLSQPGGYCTINGCDELLCPSEAVCIRIFPYESPGPACVSQTCESDQICLSNASPDPNAPTSFCEPRATERRYCEKTCGSDGDCRSGYVCRQAGIEGVTTGPTNYGSLAFVANATPTTIVKFCSPSP